MNDLIFQNQKKHYRKMDESRVYYFLNESTKYPFISLGDIVNTRIIIFNKEEVKTHYIDKVYKNMPNKYISLHETKDLSKTHIECICEKDEIKVIRINFIDKPEKYFLRHEYFGKIIFTEIDEKFPVNSNTSIVKSTQYEYDKLRGTYYLRSYEIVKKRKN